jgi:hypothetical protein
MYYYVRLCCVVSFYVIFMWCDVMFVMLCYVRVQLYNIVSCCCVVLCCAVLCCVVFSPVLCCVVLCFVLSCIMCIDVYFILFHTSYATNLHHSRDFASPNWRFPERLHFTPSGKQYCRAGRAVPQSSRRSHSTWERRAKENSTWTKESGHPWDSIW